MLLWRLANVCVSRVAFLQTTSWRRRMPFWLTWSASSKPTMTHPGMPPTHCPGSPSKSRIFLAEPQPPRLRCVGGPEIQRAPAAKPTVLLQTEHQELCRHAGVRSNTIKHVAPMSCLRRYAMTRIALGPASQKTVDDTVFIKTAELARRYEGVRLHTHLAENQVRPEA